MRFVAKFLVIVIDLGHTEHAWVLQESKLLRAFVLNIPVKYSAYEWTDQGDSRLGTCHRLGKRKQQRQIAVDLMLLLELSEINIYSQSTGQSLGNMKIKPTWPLECLPKWRKA